jgi:acetolactate synthase-1/3 small subunit
VDPLVRVEQLLVDPAREDREEGEDRGEDDEDADESLTVARTLDPTLSRMTIVVDVDPALRAQVVKQMNKLINVLQASDVTEAPAVLREMVLIRIRAALEARTAILKEAEIFRARVVDSSVEGFALEATGDPEKLNEFVDVMRAYGDIEVTRSGLIAVSLEQKKLRLAPPVLTCFSNSSSMCPCISFAG